MPRTPMILLMLLALLALIFAATGCSEDDDADLTDPNAITPATTDLDAADAVASDLGADDGGLTDQIADMSIALDGLSPTKSGEMTEPNGFAEREYDETTGTWTITIDRERGDPEGVPYAHIMRVYTLRFLDEAGDPMQFRVVDEDTARTVEFAIVSGSGEHRTRRMEQALTELNGSFVVTNVHTDLVTINGTYHRAAGHRLETHRFARTLDGVLDLELADVVAPRRWHQNHAAAVSGTINGTFVADITIERGDDYFEQHIEREFTIVLGDGMGDMVMNGMHYRLNLGNGELED